MSLTRNEEMFGGTFLMGRQTALVVTDRDGVIRLWDGDAEALIGHAASDVLGRSVDVLVPPDYRERHWAGFNTAMTSGAGRFEGRPASIPVLCADGAVRRFPGRFTLVRDASGRVVAAAAVIIEPAADDRFFEL